METPAPARQTKRRGGRPPLPEAEFRSFQFKVGLTEAENAQFIERCERVGLNSNNKSRGAFARAALLNQKIDSVPQANKNVLIALNRIGSNVNQITRKSNSGAQLGAADIAQLKEAIADLATVALGGEE